jgi:hypothetical protein
VLSQIEEQELVGLAVPDPIRTRLEAAERENSQLREALATRIIIEQAKGVGGSGLRSNRRPPGRDAACAG